MLVDPKAGSLLPFKSRKGNRRLPDPPLEERTKSIKNSEPEKRRILNLRINPSVGWERNDFPLGSRKESFSFFAGVLPC